MGDRLLPNGLSTGCKVFCSLVAGLARHTEIPACVRHGLTVQEAGNKTKAFFHHRTRFPRHPHLPLPKSEKRNPCPVLSVTHSSGRSDRSGSSALASRFLQSRLRR